MTDSKLIQQLESMVSDNRKQRFLRVLDQRTYHFTVAVEDIFQMHNASAVVRSCEVFGIQKAHFIEEQNISKISENIALGAQKWIEIYRYNNVNQCLSHLRDQNYQIVATTPHKSALDLEEFDITKPSAFLFGTEKEGLSKRAIEQADKYLSIPMHGFTESLNISVAMAIILQSLSSRLRKSNISWGLSQDEKRKIYLKWLLQTIKNSDLIMRNLKTKFK